MVLILRHPYTLIETPAAALKLRWTRQNIHRSSSSWLTFQALHWHRQELEFSFIFVYIIISEIQIFFLYMQIEVLQRKKMAKTRKSYTELPAQHDWPYFKPFYNPQQGLETYFTPTRVFNRLKQENTVSTSPGMPFENCGFWAGENTLR